MQIYTSYHEAFHACMESQTYSIAHLYTLPKNMNIDTSGCYKIFFPISGPKKFHIDNCIYDVNFNELFFINPKEWHYFSHFDTEVSHERFIIFIYPEYLKEISSPKTDVATCFSLITDNSQHNKILSIKEKETFLYYMHKMSAPEDFGSDLLDPALFLELIIFLNRISLQNNDDKHHSTNMRALNNKTVTMILSYLDSHFTECLTINDLAKHFFLSPSYLCKTFKNTTGTSIHKYISAKRITLAKTYLLEGYSVIDAGAMCGFNDYNSFLKAFTKEVGISPKKYSQFSV